MNEITIKMKRIENIIQNCIKIEEIPSVIEWFIEEPEWEEMFWTEYSLREMRPYLEQDIREFPKMDSPSENHLYPTKN